MDWKKFGNDLRKHLMTGVSYMIPFVVAGGILIAIAFLLGGIYWKSPSSEWIGNLGKVAFGFMVPALGAYIAYSIADRPAIAPGGLAAGYFVFALKKMKMPPFLKPLMPVLIIPLIGTLFVGVIMHFVLGGPVTALNAGMTSMLNGLSTGNSVLLAIILGIMMAFDMGGPVNKAAYTFGLAAIQANNFFPIASIMVAGMTPPLGIALAILIKKNKWLNIEQKGLSGLFIGAACFITEFAIPYAAADPIRVIPSLMVGSAVGAVSCTLFGVSMMAPHGGLFVFVLASSPLLWLLSILLGGLATAGMLVLLKPDLTEDQLAAE